ncbi:T6SS immunity protein Tdi1 domain-containing protein [Catenulispora pinisilvae]|uniref:T6SS immunity protein Tdi1 domain-containing protein n=1 Tax=Catenulispora pinisilvae TaxID=2705253 RepID=UPI001891B23A|nr:T6SS immunity protein Tdi1 domain-containing protein [Catenulispora pinisilvae]
MANSGFSFEALQERMPTEAARGLADHGTGDFADGFLHLVAPETLDDTLSEWLGGFQPSRTPFARTALGDLLYIRDLRERAAEIGMNEEEIGTAYDVSVVNVRYKKIGVLAYSFSDFVAGISDPEFLTEELRKDLYDGAVARLGRPGPDEMYTFVPLLAWGGSEDSASLDRVKAGVALDILFQA